MTKEELAARLNGREYMHEITAEEQAEEACYECAMRNGHTVTEAEDCDDGDVGCPDCPWKISEKGG